MEKILDKCVNYSLSPVLRKIGNYKKYFYLYRIKNVKTNEFYIGFRVFKGKDPYKDQYFGGGMTIKKGGIIGYHNNNPTDFVKSVYRHGLSSFKKEIICFFYNKEDGLLSERQVVDEEMLKNPLCLNMIIGGGKPPSGSGKKNNNYGNYWTASQKKRLSDLRKKNGKSKGVLNVKATECSVLDCRTGNIYHFPYLIYGANKLNVSYLIINKIVHFRYLTLKGNKEKKDFENFISQCDDKEVLTPYLTNVLYNMGASKKEIESTGISINYINRFLKRISQDESN